MNMTCQSCGRPIPRQNGPGGRRKYCPTCSPKRDRPDRVKKARVTSLTSGTTSHQRDNLSPTNVYAATEAELEAASVVESVMGQCALILAKHIDADNQNGSGLAALVKAHREAMAAAPPEDNTLARLRRLRGLDGA